MGKCVQGTKESTWAEKVTFVLDLETSGTGFFMATVVSFIFDGVLHFTALFLASLFSFFDFGSLDFTPQSSAKLRSIFWQQRCLQRLCGLQSHQYIDEDFPLQGTKIISHSARIFSDVPKQQSPIKNGKLIFFNSSRPLLFKVTLFAKLSKYTMMYNSSSEEMFSVYPQLEWHSSFVFRLEFWINRKSPMLSLSPGNIFSFNSMFFWMDVFGLNS